MQCEQCEQATMYECVICDHKSGLERTVEEHVKECHPSCMPCWGIFYDHLALREHLLKSGRHNYCGSCGLDFPSQAARRQHYLESIFHNFCGICELEFSTPAALRGHQQTHLPRDIECPRCDMSFTSASAMAKHMELGKCFGLTHGQFIHHVRDWERNAGYFNLFTSPQTGYWSNDGSPGLFQATSAAYNGSVYECSFCPRACFQLAHLNQHLGSGIHLLEEFCCRECGYTATWLSALLEHIESEKCGFTTRSQVKDVATSIAQTAQLLIAN